MTLQDKYDELIYAVGKKYQGETRHQTALRYIKQAESFHYESGRAAFVLGTLGGRVKSPAKSAASRRNGKLGGRPAKVQR
jgi:hypothetical protein